MIKLAWSSWWQMCVFIYLLGFETLHWFQHCFSHFSVIHSLTGFPGKVTSNNQFIYKWPSTDIDVHFTLKSIHFFIILDLGQSDFTHQFLHKYQVTRDNFPFKSHIQFQVEHTYSNALVSQDAVLIILWVKITIF